MMNRIILLAIFLVGCIATYAQLNYQIVEYKGVVEYRTASSDWRLVQSNLTLRSIDSIRIHKSAYVKINYRNENYQFTLPCTDNMYSLLRQGRAARTSHFSIAGVLKEINSGKTEPVRMLQVGAGEARGTLSEDYDLIADQLEWIGSQVVYGAAISPIEGIALNQIVHAGNEVEFEFVNNTNCDYCMNVLHINKRTRTLSLCYVITDDVKKEACLVTPRGYKTCGMDIYFPNTEDDLYVLVALDSPYNSMALDEELSYRRISEDTQNVDIKIIYAR